MRARPASTRAGRWTSLVKTIDTADAVDTFHDIVVDDDDDGVLRELSWFLLRLMVSVYVAWWSTS